jgi:hypothetical protein
MALFNAENSLGRKSRSEIASYLTDIGNLDEARHFHDGAVAGQSFGIKRPYEHTGCILGYIFEAKNLASASQIVSTSQIAGDESLIDQRIKITLDKFYIDTYPGFGTHTVLCEFSGKNQVPEDVEELRFALRFKSNDKAAAPISGAPIFMGVNVSRDGIAFEGRAVNVSSSADESLIATFDSPAFKAGLTLLTSAQPALKPFSSLASSVVSTVASRSKNTQVHNFNLGLDFGQGSTSVRLKTGSYIIVQTDSSNWNWNDFEWRRDSNSLEYKANPGQKAGFNYMVIGVSRFS